VNKKNTKSIVEEILPFRFKNVMGIVARCRNRKLGKEELDLRGLLSPSSPLHRFLFQGRLSWERGFVILSLCCRYLNHFRNTTGRQISAVG
jgi:hypothetical protein